ncbi:MAG: carboxypeptidase regulatory-like domain-containing protein [Planctomycetes bacterium]|nr:carboxypeptidase regulatory-like domain-containing protein [Planctomycetota bacterium]
MTRSSPPRRSSSPLLFVGLAALVLFLLAPMVAMLMLGEPPVPVPESLPSNVAPPTAAPAAAPVGERTRQDGPAGTLVARAAVPVAPLPGAGLADRPTAWLQVVDRDQGTPLSGAAVRRVRTGAELTFTDERGLAAVPLGEPEQLAVVLDDYLLRMAPTSPGSSEAAPQVVRLVRDRWSLLVHCNFTPPPGRTADLVCVRFRLQGKPGPGPAAVAADPVVARAWYEHELLAGQAVCRDVPVQVGAFQEERVHRLTKGTAVRFLVPGTYTVEAATPDGLCGSAEFRVDATASPVHVPVALGQGAVLRGTVLGAGRPLAGAELRLQGGDPLDLLATSGGDGSFALGPLLPGPVTVLVRHAEHRATAAGPFAPTAAARIVLEPLPTTSLRGRVRRRPGLEPVVGAKVVWRPTGGAPAAADSQADGSFVVAAAGEVEGRLSVVAPGCIAYAELVAPGAPFADYDLWPLDRDERVGLGLTASLQGVVVDAAQRPQAGVAVRWVPAQATPPSLPTGRRVLDGGVLVLPQTATTAADGSFVLETDQFGPGRVELVAGGAARQATTAAGTVCADLRLVR